MNGKPARIGFVGAGWWAVSNHIPRIAADPRAELAGVCRLGQAELNAVRDRFGFPFATEDFDELLDKVPMDGLVISSPHRLHTRHAMAAMERGIHVLIEKPLATNAVDARAIVTAAQRSGVHALVPYGWNFKPYFATARDWISTGRIGEIRHVSGNMASPIGDLMSGTQMAGTEDEMFRPDPAMWADPATGGYGWGQLIHLLGALFHLADGLVPQSVTAMTGNAEGGADLYNAAALRFAGGATGAFSGAATLPPGSPFKLDLDFFGTDGVLMLAAHPARLTLRQFDGTVEEVPLEEKAGAYECLEPVDRFVALCAGEAVENAGPVSCAARAVDVVAAMLQSAKSGKIIEIGEAA